MATKTIINCLDTSTRSPDTATPFSSSSPPGISIIIDPHRAAISPNTCSNVIKIQHSCPESQLTMTANSSSNNNNNNNHNNKTLIDINCNNKSDSNHDSQETHTSLLATSSASSTPSSSSSFSSSPSPASSSSTLLNVFKVKCLAATEENLYQKMLENGKSLEMPLEVPQLSSNGALLVTGSESLSLALDKDHDDQCRGQEKEKQELTQTCKESGQTAKTMSSTSTTTTTITTKTNTSANLTTTNTTTTTTTIDTTSQQVNGNSKQPETNGHFGVNQTSNEQDALHDNEQQQQQHNHLLLQLQTHHHLPHDDNDVKPGTTLVGSGKRVTVSDEPALVIHSNDNDNGDDDDDDDDDVAGDDEDHEHHASDSGGKHSLAVGNANSLLTKADTATTQLRSITSKLTINENLTPQNGNKENCEESPKAHVVKIQINPKKAPEKQISIVKIENLEKPNTELPASDATGKQSDSKDLTTKIVQKNKSDLHLQIQEKMVQKPFTASSNNNNNNNNNSHHAGVTVSGSNVCNGSATVATSTPTSSGASSGSTTVTELNVTNPNYLYYMMSSGQFSPCDTLDSGTGSDLEIQQHSSQSPINTHPMLMKKTSNNLEMHLKTTKIRVSNSSKDQRNCSFTDSEESEASSLSCDSLHSNEFIRQSSSSPVQQTKISSPSTKILGSYLPDSLLRDIKNLKFSHTDYEAENENDDNEDEEEAKKQRTKSLKSLAAYETLTSPDYKQTQNDYVQTRNSFNNSNNSNANNANNHNFTLNSLSASLKRASLPSKTFVLNQEDGTFIDTKMNSMPRKYEADKYYNFHVNEHENFRSFGNNSARGGLGGCAGLSGVGEVGDGDSLCIAEFDSRSLQDDVFAGYKDIRCGSATSTIRSSKGTVRGVKNRVRNGIATFLQLQQPNVKNYKEKDSGKVVLYTTSMGIIRDTYAKCSNVKQILRTLLIKFEERDVFMSVEYQQEIKERMHSEIIKVPQLFVEGQHIGDADTVERLNESGELRQLLKPYKSISTTYTCQTCGGYRLLPCPSCNGSKKSVHRNHFTAEFVALKCMNCDEVGLVKCHNC